MQDEAKQAQPRDTDSSSYWTGDEEDTPVNRLRKAAELALWCIPPGPTLGAFGHARDDCALVHMDYFVGLDYAQHILAEAIADVTGANVTEVIKEHGHESRLCDGACCVGTDAAVKAAKKYRESYTYVKEWTRPVEAAVLRPQKESS
jgi:hypothetical protein